MMIITIHSIPVQISFSASAGKTIHTLMERRAGLAAYMILLVGCFSAACVTVTQSGNLIPMRRPRYSDVCWTGDGVVAIVAAISFAMYIVTTRGHCGIIFIPTCFNCNPM